MASAQTGGTLSAARGCPCSSGLVVPAVGACQSPVSIAPILLSMFSLPRPMLPLGTNRGLNPKCDRPLRILYGPGRRELCLLCCKVSVPRSANSGAEMCQS